MEIYRQVLAFSEQSYFSRADKVSFAFKRLRSLSEIKSVKVKGKSYSLLAFQWYIIPLSFFKNNANKSDFPIDTPEGWQ